MSASKFRIKCVVVIIKLGVSSMCDFGEVVALPRAFTHSLGLEVTVLAFMALLVNGKHWNEWWYLAIS